MRKSLFAIGLLAAIGSVQAQNVLLHVDDTANMYVSDGTLVYNGGGLQTRGAGVLDVHGNVMVEGAGANTITTITTGGAPKTDGGNIILRLNDPTNYDTSTYGQLYVNNILQGNATGIVSKEYRTGNQGSGNYFQQIALPFAAKQFSSLSAELGKTFNTSRYDNSILSWNNTNVVSDHVTDLSSNIGNVGDVTNVAKYYMLSSRNNNLNMAGSVHTLSGRPFTTQAAANHVYALQGAGAAVNFGTNGNNTNQYNEKYNTYLQDQFSNTTGAFSNVDYGKNIYQFGNPYLTNIDLSRIGYTEAGIGDGNAVSNIWGVKYSAGTVTTYPNGTTYTAGAQTQTFNVDGTPIGDTGLIIKPMQTFVLKLRNNSAQTLNFATLRRFAGTVRADGTDYSVVAAKNAAGVNKVYTGSVKQLGVIALDASGKEVGRTYYVVTPTATTGHQISSATSIQAGATGGDAVGTFEEAPNGGYDNNNTNYWLYINEANESNFKGKNVKLVTYDTNTVKSYKFEIKENAQLIASGAHTLSSGIGFYYKAPNGTVQEAKQGDVIPVSGTEYDLYYGSPNDLVLAAEGVKATPSRTLVLLNPAIDNYIVRFDPNWKKADIEVYDMSGKLVISKKSVNTSSDFVIELDKKIKNSYIVKVVSDKGEIVNTKILK